MRSANWPPTPTTPPQQHGLTSRPPSGETATEFLVTFTPAVPEGTPAKDVDEATAREAWRASELARQGHLVRLWVLPAEQGVSSALGLWRASGPLQMQGIVQSLPLYPYLRTWTTQLTPHPSDPAAPGSRSLRVAYGSTANLAGALRRAAAAHGRHEAQIGHADPDWPDWYAVHMVQERTESGCG